MEEPTHTVHTVGGPKEVSFVKNALGETVAHIMPHEDGFSVSIYDEPQPPPAVTLAMNTRNECLAALTGFLEARRIDNE